MRIRPATRADDDAIWAIMEPTLRAGETYALPRDWTREQALGYWHAEGHDVFVAEDGGRIFGTYYLQANQKGGGGHVANCGYMTAPDATGRGIAAAMCAHSLERAAARGFRAMQFNIVVSTNTRAVALWQRMGFAIVGTVPGAFHHPIRGYVDTYVMFRTL
jgi:ribosomal protein S18 acetylase RimI-like enzyme